MRNGRDSDTPVLRRLRTFTARALASLILLAPHAAGASDRRASLLVQPARQALVQVAPQRPLRERLPDTLFGFNINVVHFQADLWDDTARVVKPSVVSALREFPGGLYRYPGGLIANRFRWEWALGDAEARVAHKLVSWTDAFQVRFGVAEYFNFVADVRGRPWIVLNLVGWDTQSMANELPVAAIAQSNATVASYWHEQARDAEDVHYYQLGNELDRSIYQWPATKYVQRARAAMAEVRAVDPKARFVAFLRDFDWRYRGTEAHRGVSRARDFTREVLEGLPTVDDFSIHFYYEGVGPPARHAMVAHRLPQLLSAIDTGQATRRGRPVRVWVTEHAPRWAPRAGADWRHTSNLDGAISTSDFLIAMAQIPEIEGAAWHALNGGPWMVFDAEASKAEPAPRPLYWALRVLRKMDLQKVVETTTHSPNLSGYAGGYDIRAAGFTSADGADVGLWIVNRHDGRHRVSVSGIANPGRYRLSHYHVAADEGLDSSQDRDITATLEPTVSEVTAEPGGNLAIEVPARSVSTVIWRRLRNP